jgi:phosphohistidine phosphatase
MKKIVFIRHGRAEDPSSEITDFDRSLTIRGKVISRMMARVFRENEKDPGLIITSPAFRALETAFIFASEFGIKPERIRIESDLYYKTNLKILLNILNLVSDETNIITLFGHNPAFTEMADRLSIEGWEFMTKTSIACMSFSSKTWSGIKPGTGKPEYFLKPEKTE